MSFVFNIRLIQLIESQTMSVCMLTVSVLDIAVGPPNNRSFRFNLFTFCLQLRTSCPVRFATQKTTLSVGSESQK